METTAPTPTTVLPLKTTKKSKSIYSVNCVVKIYKISSPEEISLEAKGDSTNKILSVTTKWPFKLYVD